ncbi:hypothetical protein B0H34DRAFT_175344 [Crassisporium funariophilum]|nr:hypothetical protein B0H34DRAFT_175344 [Crassisporium funariophilum]
MNTYHTLPNCMDIKEADGECLSSKVLQSRSINSGICSTFFPEGWSDMGEANVCAFAEAAISPAKYSIFQVLGCKSLQAIGHPGISMTISSSARVGAVGGATLALLYFAMLFARKDGIWTENAKSRSYSSYGLLLIKEMAYSGLSAAIGALSSGLNDQRDILLHIIAGFLGTLLFLCLMIVALGLIIWIAWVTEKSKDWYSGY